MVPIMKLNATVKMPQRIYHGVKSYMAAQGLAYQQLEREARAPSHRGLSLQMLVNEMKFKNILKMGF